MIGQFSLCQSSLTLIELQDSAFSHIISFCRNAHCFVSLHYRLAIRLQFGNRRQHILAVTLRSHIELANCIDASVRELLHLYLAALELSPVACSENRNIHRYGKRRTWRIFVSEHIPIIVGIRLVHSRNLHSNGREEVGTQYFVSSLEQSHIHVNLTKRGIVFYLISIRLGVGKRNRILVSL